MDALFTICAAVCFISACGMVTRKNPVYSVVWMLPLFLGMTIIFYLLSAPFLAAMLILVYGGAILVLFLFVIMLINLRPEEIKDDTDPKGYMATAVLAAVMGGVVYAFAKTALPEDSVLETAFRAPILPPEASSDAIKALPQTHFGSVESIGFPLFNRWVVPFELAAILITVAVLGAVMISKRNLRPGGGSSENAEQEHH